MRVVALNPCSHPKCNANAIAAIELDNGAKPYKVCGRHIQWGKTKGYEVEDS